MKKINVLGTVYTMCEVAPAEDAKLEGNDGYTDTSTKVIVVDSMQENDPKNKGNLPEYKKAVKRHELVHAFLYESGLDACSWAPNEELVDWIAIQAPKLLKAFNDADAL